MPADKSASGQELTSPETGASNEADPLKKQDDQQQQQTDDGPWSDPESAKAEIEKLRKESASYRTKFREAEPLAKRARELEDKDKTEQQRLADELAETKKRAQEAELLVLRNDVADAKKLPASMARRLRGTTQEELEEDADVLLKELKAVGASAPKVDLKQGDRGTSSDANDVDAWLRKAAGRT